MERIFFDIVVQGIKLRYVYINSLKSKLHIKYKYCIIIWQYHKINDKDITEIDHD